MLCCWGTKNVRLAWRLPNYCEFGNFRENLIFANSVKRHTCDAQTSRLRHDTPISVNDRVILLFCEGFNFHETSHSRKYNPHKNFRIYSIAMYQDCYSIYHWKRIQKHHSRAVAAYSKVVLWRKTSSAEGRKGGENTRGGLSPSCSPNPSTRRFFFILGPSLLG